MKNGKNYEIHMLNEEQGRQYNDLVAALHKTELQNRELIEKRCNHINERIGKWCASESKKADQFRKQARVDAMRNYRLFEKILNITSKAIGARK